jgi:hypothetical protein
MKQIIPFLLLTIFLISCSSQTPVTTPTNPTQAQVINTDKIAEDFVKSLPEYSDYNGGNLNMIRKIDAGYEKIDYVFRFDVNTPKLASSVKLIEVRLMMQEGEVTHDLAVEVEQADLKSGALSQSECESMGGRLANNIAGALCNSGEQNKGDLVGFIIPYVCCV